MASGKRGRLPRRVAASTALSGCIMAVILLLVLMAAAGGIAEVKRTAELELWWALTETKHTPAGVSSPRSGRIKLLIKANLAMVSEFRDYKSFIFNLDTKRFWLVDYRRRSIAEGTLDKLRQLCAEKRSKETTDLERRENKVEKLSGELAEKRRLYVEGQRKLLELAGMKLKTHAKRGREEIINGYPCRAVEVYTGSDRVATVWVATGIEPPRRWNELIGIIADVQPEKWKPVQAAGGIPVKLDFDYGGTQTDWRLNRYTTTNISINNFMLPSYKFVEPKID